MMGAAGRVVLVVCLCTLGEVHPAAGQVPGTEPVPVSLANAGTLPSLSLSDPIAPADGGPPGIASAFLHDLVDQGTYPVRVARERPLGFALAVGTLAVRRRGRSRHRCGLRAPGDRSERAALVGDRTHRPVNQRDIIVTLDASA